MKTIFFSVFIPLGPTTLKKLQKKKKKNNNINKQNIITRNDLLDSFSNILLSWSGGAMALSKLSARTPYRSGA